MAHILCIHGMWSTPATWTGIKQRLEAAGHDVHAPALPFHDREAALLPAPELGLVTVEDYARFLVAAVAALPEPPVIIGHSMGGMLAQIVAARVPHRGLVLLSTAATAATPAVAFSPLRTMAGVVTHWNWWKHPTLIDADRARWGIYNGVPEDIAAREIAGLVWDSGRVLAEMILPGLSTTGATKVDHGRLVKPALVIVGSEDRITPPGISRATARRIAGTIDYHEIAGASHWLFWGDTERRVGDYIEDWLKLLPA